MLNASFNTNRLTALVKEKAVQEGFFSCGISAVHELPGDKKKLELWLQEKHNAEMSYMERNIDSRANPGFLLKNARSVISLLLLYKVPFGRIRNDIYISKYAWGKDYHSLLKKKLNNIIKFLKEIMPQTMAEACVDSSPVFEKRWAQQSGLGWRGKHTILINREVGSFFFLGEIITNLSFEYDKPVHNMCGNCTKCIDACPTGALVRPYHLDARRCIAYHTIENKRDFDKNAPVDFKKYIFGCDICQDVCPWNDNIIFDAERTKELNLKLLQMSPEKWLSLSDEEFNELAKNSCIRRTGLSAIKRNVRHVLKK